MEGNNLQRELFNYIKTVIPSHIAMVDSIADLLSISQDSVYRRIRGEKPITLDELKLLCDHFRISLDQAMQLKSDSVVFTDPEVANPVNNFSEYLQQMQAQLQFMVGFQNKRMLYLAKDIPFFYFFLLPELTAFKSFFWSKSILNDPAFAKQSFSLKSFDNDIYLTAGKQILDLYNKIPCVEIWNYESVNSTVLQIEYYRDAGIFETNADLEQVIHACILMLDHMELQAEKGCKFFIGAPETAYQASLKLYVNEIILGNNSIMVELDGYRRAFINHVVLKYIFTSDQSFTDKMFSNFNNLASRATLISETGERDRRKFFKRTKERVLALQRQ